MKLPNVSINGTQLDILDYLAILGVMLVLIGLALLGAPFVLIGIGLAAIAASRIEWHSSTDSGSSQNPNQEADQDLKHPTAQPGQ